MIPLHGDFDSREDKNSEVLFSSEEYVWNNNLPSLLFLEFLNSPIVSLLASANICCEMPLFQVAEGSLANRAGLHEGDLINQLLGHTCGNMKHKQAQDTIMGAGNHLDMIVQRYYRTPLAAGFSVSYVESPLSHHGIRFTNWFLSRYFI